MGLDADTIVDYWTKRAERYAREGHWGLRANTIEEHEAQVAERAAFIFETCPRDLRTLDYGCGIGMYTPFFNHATPEEPKQSGNYIGIDLAEAHLAIARERNPRDYFVQIKTPIWDEPFSWPFDLFFTATVLQHCSDDVVSGLFQNIARKRPGRFRFSLYEYANPDSTNVQTVGRLPEEYIEMVGKWCKVLGTQSRSHVIAGGVCAHTLIDVEVA